MRGGWDAGRWLCFTLITACISYLSAFWWDVVCVLCDGALVVCSPALPLICDGCERMRTGPLRHCEMAKVMTQLCNRWIDFFFGFRLTPRCHPLAESIGQGLLHAFRWRFIPGTEGAEGERWSLCSRCVWSKFVLFPPSICLREMALLCWLAVNFARYLLDVRRGQRNSVGWHRFGLDHVHPVFQLVEEVNEYQVVNWIFFFLCGRNRIESFTDWFWKFE